LSRSHAATMFFALHPHCLEQFVDQMSDRRRSIDIVDAGARVRANMGDIYSATSSMRTCMSASARGMRAEELSRTQFAAACFPRASPQNKRRASVRPTDLTLDNFTIFGAGEGIRTLDPDLGKVVAGVCTCLLTCLRSCCISLRFSLWTAVLFC